MPDDLTGGIAAALAGGAPAGWARITLTVSSTVLADDYALQAKLADGRNGSMAVPAAVKAGFEQLRERMYEPGRGTWFSATVELRAGAAPEFAYNFDDDPRWWPPLHPTAFARDLETFPRDEGHIPPWLRELLDEGAQLERQRTPPAVP
ncbi:hypothetical protein ACIRSS_14815 [Amycolatopsis sp. NPDC101161]|uniref:hypothetical protein n=1 Tax=Amycolatopsis sp. NPDC101161 TaxID=3363940 RepID=UPI00382A39E6